jgi:hypothetical protein
MRFISALMAGALAVVATAQVGTGSNPNPFTNSNYSGIATGSPVPITWTPTTKGTVSLLLVQGDPNALVTVATISSASSSLHNFPVISLLLPRDLTGK